jgi:hypothetical protein
MGLAIIQKPAVHPLRPAIKARKGVGLRIDRANSKVGSRDLSYNIILEVS